MAAITAAMPALAVRRLEPNRAFEWRRLGELWRYRELLYFLVWRDVRVRYTQAALGIGWAVIQPVMSMVVFTIFFGRLAHMPSDGTPYALFSLCALVPWTYFSTAVSAGSVSLVGQRHVISKVYFPRLLVPLAAVAAPLVDFAIAFVILLAVMAAYGVLPSAAVVWLPCLVALAIATAAAATIWLAALTALYRDVRYVVPFAMQLWLFATPVAYPASLVPSRWRLFYGLNPMAGIVEGFRWALVGGPAPGGMTAVAVAIVAVALGSGLVFFRRVEGTLVDKL
jgi:lipopolysaccharide transport system permease protein